MDNNVKRNINANRARALLLPTTYPSRMACGSIFSFDQHYDYHEALAYEASKNWSSFAVLRDDRLVHDVVFLNPFDALTAIDADIVIFDDQVKIYRVKEFRSWIELKRFLNKNVWNWLNSYVIVISKYIAEVAVGNIKFIKTNNNEYCYGRVYRVVRRIDADSLLGSIDVKVINNSKDKVKSLINFLARFNAMPGCTLGLLISKREKLMLAFDSKSADLVSIDDLDAVAIFQYHFRNIPVLIIKRIIKRLSHKTVYFESSLSSAIMNTLRIHRGGEAL